VDLTRIRMVSPTVRNVVAVLALATSVLGSCPFSGVEDKAELPAGHPQVSENLNAADMLCPHMFGDDKVDPGTTTVQGCECESTCGATVDFGKAKCDWCYTKNGCGHFSVTRLKHYDFCVYPENKTFESQTWEEKTEQLWSKIIADKTHGDYPNVLGIISESIQTSFFNHWDYSPAGRKKYIHSVGAVCKVGFEIESGSYTGLLAPGQTAHGFMRMGSAVPIDDNGINPGIGYKFLRTGVESGNFVSLHQLSQGFTWDFFSVNQSNFIPPPTGALKVLAQKFAQVSGCVNMVGLSDLCKIGQDGTVADNLNFPYQLVMTPEMHFANEPTDLDGYMGRFEAIKTGTVLYTINAIEYPGATPVRIGKIVTESICTPSAFGDARLQTRHQRWEEDLQLRPQWKNMMDPDTCWPVKVGGDPPSKCEDETEACSMI